MPALTTTLPDDVSPAVVDALDAMARLTAAWDDYQAARAVATRRLGSAHGSGGMPVGQYQRRFALAVKMLPTRPTDVLEAAHQNAVVLATARAGTTHP